MLMLLIPKAKLRDIINTEVIINGQGKSQEISLVARGKGEKYYQHRGEAEGSYPIHRLLDADQKQR